MKQRLAAGERERQVAEFVEDDEVEPAEMIGDACRPVGITAFSAAPTHIAPGDCLLSEETTLAEADFIYVSEQVTPTKRYELSARYDLGDITFSANRKRVIKKAEGYASGKDRLAVRVEG